MKTYHFYKTDCFKASRLLLEKGWDDESIFVHRGNDKGSIRLSMMTTLQICKKTSKNEPCVFHAQSSLPYLLIFVLTRLIMLGSQRVVYDVHDLHERDGNGLRPWTRYILLGLMERLVFKLPFVHVITVSNGLADILQKKYKKKGISVVMSVPPRSRIAIDDVTDKKESKEVLLFFGTGERVPRDELNLLKEEGLRLHVYGRNMPKELLEDAREGEYVKFFGAYDPQNMHFLSKYRYLLLVSRKKSENFRFSLPNKLFQSLRAGVIPIVGPNFEEMINIFTPISGALIVWDGSSRLRVAITNNGSVGASCKDEIQDFLDKLHDESRDKYLLAIGKSCL